MGYAHADKSSRGVDREMKKEDADQLIRCVKECWWRVLIIFAIPSFALVAVKSDWPWKESPWAAAAAVATFFAGVVALCLGVTQVKKERAARIARGRIAASYIEPVAKKTAGTLGLYLANVPVNLSEQQRASLSGLWAVSRITRDDLASYAEISPKNAMILAQSISILENVLQISGIPKDVSNTFDYAPFLRALSYNDLRGKLINNFSALGEDAGNWKQG